ncbi:hypothetical protein COU58_02540 [Candidatus Pacearchaeota archaeon CG10_big_fil_rev_8_21_14_0_10_32_42]|nr:MAG: hypothetical protein COU58_02540 [Candidatus Pacearchaeota archaeon CG10_big_fil_rev_8_21_14_0_10_32_42]
MNSIVLRIAELIKVKDLMTSDIYYYSGLPEDIEFCRDRDIEWLPLRSSRKYMLFDKKTETFIEREIKQEEIISPEMIISDYIEATKKADLFFVMDKTSLIGIIHFSDLINSWAYIYFYAIFHEFEKQVRDILSKKDKHNEDFFEWYKNTKINNLEKNEEKKLAIKNLERIEKEKREIILPKFQYFDLRDLLKFMKYEKIDINGFPIENKVIKSIPDIRNTIMHHKDISPRQNNEGVGSKFLYRRDAYDKFLEGYDLTLRMLKIEQSIK